MNATRRLTLCLAAAAALAPGCRTPVGPAPQRAAAPPPQASDDADTGLPAEIQATLLPPLELPATHASDGESEPRFDVAVHQAPARDFFLNLVAETPYDIVVHPKVEGSLSLSMRDATVPEILDAVREVYGYGYRRIPSGYYVLPAEIQSRIFQVDYLHMARQGQSQTRVSSGQLSERSGESSGASRGLGPTTSGGERTHAVLESSDVRTRSQADFWQELERSLRALIGEGEGRSVVVSPQAGIVVVRGLPEELSQVAEYLESAERSLQRQVVLEAKILEIELSDGRRTGVNWGALIASGAKSGLFGQTGGGSFFEDGLSEIAGNAGLLDPRALALPSNTDTSAFGGVFSAALDLGDFAAFVELLETQGDVHVLSSPRISTLNNQKAVIKVGSDEFFVTDVSTTTVTGTVATTTPEVTLTPFFSGIALDVLPQISADGHVTLHVHPSVSQVVDQVKQITVGEDDLTLPLAFSTIRESDTIVRARSGQVVVIGGLIQEQRADERASIPLLGRIPWIGRHLFGQSREGYVQSELVILLRPRVVDDGEFAPELERAGRSIEDPRAGSEARDFMGRHGWSAER